ncbi:MAG: endonuclease/exonuclease/phosphatase family protein [Lentisphaerae bacterium]|nr:endonuclease/exonuclease/phosphatase family protein [Lentisphaerota bacterium]
MKVMTCNIRTSAAADGPNAWALRRDVCARVIRDHAPDVFGVQEMTDEQFDDLAAAFPAYDTHAVDRANTIFYDARQYRRLAAGGYWLSETPHVPGSKSWGSACVRTASWIHLAHRETGFAFRIINTHLDHVGQAARERQARLLVEDAAAWGAALPQILTGDMNADADNAAITTLTEGGWTDTYGAVHGSQEPGDTFHEFLGRGCTKSLGRIDWIFMRGALRVQAAAIVIDAPAGRHPSDHYFVSATVALMAP